MATDKYDLHTIDYSVQGWDSILTTDMEKLDDVIPTKELVVLGETVTEGAALYQKAADSKWYKAQADGTKQPVQGLACEGGVLDDTIRLQRMSCITVSTWSWGTIAAPIYLSDATSGVLTQSKPGRNVQVVGYALASTKMLITLVDLTPNLIENVLTKLSTTTVAFNAIAATTLYTGPTGKLYIPVLAVIRAGADAAVTIVTFGRVGALTDWLAAQTLSNLDADGDQVLVMPIPSATPVKQKTYAAGVVFQIDVTTNVGGATNNIDLFGFLIDV